MKRIIFCSGAGVSAAAGIPTFRDANGLWHNHKIEDVCNFSTWRDNFQLVHELYNMRRAEVWNKEPTPFHRMVASLQQEFGSDRVINITTNVDDLFEKAGCLNVIHLHGELNKISMDWEKVRDGYEEPLILTQPFHDFYNYPKSKPFVVFFGEGAPEYGKMWRISANVTMDDLVVVIGSSENVISFTDEFCNASKIWFVNNQNNHMVHGYGIKKHIMTSNDFTFTFNKQLKDHLDEI